MTDTFPGMIPLGYFIVRKSGKKPRPFWITPDYLTVAGCLCEGVIPGIESVPFDDGKKEEIRREWDLPSREARRAATCHGRGGRPCRRKAPPTVCRRKASRRGAAPLDGHSRATMQSSTSPMYAVGSKRATTFPSRSMTNLVKFHLMSGLAAQSGSALENFSSRSFL